MEASDQPAGADGGGGADKLRLKVASGNAAGSMIEVEDELVIGRQATGAGSLGNDIEISRRHARIFRDAGGCPLIEDLGSTNGTYVNGRVIEAPVQLETGDRIEVGGSALIVQVTAPPPTPRSTPVTTTAAVAEAEAEPAEVANATEVEAAGEEAGEPDHDLRPGLPRLGLRIEVDPEAGEVVIALDEDGGEARFVHEQGAWRVKESG